jgi:hypothetical protein
LPDFTAKSCAEGDNVKYVNRTTYRVAFWEFDDSNHTIRGPYPVHNQSPEEKPLSIYGLSGVAHVISTAMWMGPASQDFPALSFQLLEKAEVEQNGEPVFPSPGQPVFTPDPLFRQSHLMPNQGAGEICVGDANYWSGKSSAAYLYTRTWDPYFYIQSRKCIAASRKL